MKIDPKTLSLTHPTMFFDGLCNFCHFWVRFILQRDPGGTFRFASLQTPLGSRAMNAAGLTGADLNTIVFVTEGEAHIKSAAALHIAKKMPGLWPLLFGFMLVPRPVRDAVYDFVARNRYRWFGKKEACPLPPPGIADRFLS